MPELRPALVGSDVSEKYFESAAEVMEPKSRFAKR